MSTTDHLLGPGNSLASGRYTLRHAFLVYEANETTTEALWWAKDHTHQRVVLLHELRLPLVPLSARQQATRTIIQIREKLAPTLPGIQDFFVERERLYFVTHAPQGITLQQKVAQGVLSEQAMLTCCLDLCDLVEILHQQKVFHGCLTPASVLYTRTGQWSITHLPLLSLLASTLLTPANDWRFPLPFSGARSAALADVDAMVALAIFALTGIVPRQPGNRQLFPRLAEDLRQLFTQGLHPDPFQRYQSIGDLRRDLAHLLAQRGSLRTPQVRQGETALSRSGRLIPAATAVLAQQPTVPQRGVNLPPALSVAPASPASPLMEPPGPLDHWVPLGWIVVLNLALLFLATRGGIQ